MNVKFDIVRIGKIRRNPISEIILKQNVDILKNHIVSLLTDIDSETSVAIVLVIPGKGHSIKIALEDVKSKEIRTLLRRNLADFIYKGGYSTIMNNVENKIWGGY